MIALPKVLLGSTWGRIAFEPAMQFIQHRFASVEALLVTFLVRDFFKVPAAFFPFYFNIPAPS